MEDFNGENSVSGVPSPTRKKAAGAVHSAVSEHI